MIVIVRLAGGLGNQLFQYAAGRALARARGARLLLDVSGYDNERLGRQYRLDRFRVRARAIRSGGLLGRVRRRVQRCLPQRWRRLVFTEEKLSFDSRLLEIDRSVELRGYWQSERYLAGIAPMLRQELTFRDPPAGANAALAKEIAGVEAVCVHVRRGDYVTNSSHVVLPAAYYRSAVEHIKETVPAPHYYVFSDAIPWCREHLPLPGPATFVDHNGPEADYEDLRLMSLCKHHVIANSSFSWWGAWLAEWPEQVVVAPGQWFANPSRTTHHLIPDRWERL
jgi:hypothetical protein